MLSTSGPLILSSVACLLAALCAFFCFRCVKLSSQTTLKAYSRSKLAELETSLTELSDAYSALMESHRKLRARITMRQHRQNGASADSVPDWREDPAGYKRAMRQKHLGR